MGVEELLKKVHQIKPLQVFNHCRLKRFLCNYWGMLFWILLMQEDIGKYVMRDDGLHYR